MIFRVYELYDGIIYRHLYTFVNLCSWKFLTSKAHFFKIYLCFSHFRRLKKIWPHEAWSVLEAMAASGSVEPGSCWGPCGKVSYGQSRWNGKSPKRWTRQDDERLFQVEGGTFWWSRVGSYEKKESEEKKPDDFFRMMLNGWSGSIDLSNWQESWKLGQCPLNRSWTGLVGLTNWIHNYVSLFVEYRDESARRTAFGMTDVN